MPRTKERRQKKNKNQRINTKEYKKQRNFPLSNLNL